VKRGERNDEEPRLSCPRCSDLSVGLPNLKQLECDEVFLSGEIDEPDIYTSFFSTSLVSRLESFKIDCDEAALGPVARAAAASKIERMVIVCPRSAFWGDQIV
jgi:hypothetical protein